MLKLYQKQILLFLFVVTQFSSGKIGYKQSQKCYSDVRTKQVDIDGKIKLLRNNMKKEPPQLFGEDNPAVDEILQLIKQARGVEDDINMSNRRVNLSEKVETKLIEDISVKQNKLAKIEKTISKQLLKEKRISSIIQDITTKAKNLDDSIATLTDIHKNILETCNTAKIKYEELNKEMARINSEFKEVTDEKLKIENNISHIYSAINLTSKDAFINMKEIGLLKIPENFINLYFCKEKHRSSLNSILDENIKYLMESRQKILDINAATNKKLHGIISEDTKLASKLYNEIEILNHYLEEVEKYVETEPYRSLTFDFNDIDKKIEAMEFKLKKISTDSENWNKSTDQLKKIKDRMIILKAIFSESNLKDTEEEIEKAERYMVTLKETNRLEKEIKALDKILDELKKQIYCNIARSEP